MDKLTIRLIGKKDRNGHDYYTSTCQAPCLIDLSKAVIHFFPDEDGDNFGGDLVVRKYDKRDKQNGDDGGDNRRNKS